ncbi:alpha-L-fucosidase [Devriesea agamarum]|uniref:alpha-L-fucosidase n=1 Tax=Devriesea agamarum TaxID=472569 RepID=UPI00071D28B7|nr:alpha-L-fucosidase [Devriesea agamarum]
MSTGPSDVRPRPTPSQLAWQQTGYGVFFHFGINTFHGQEWSDGTLPADTFNPTDLDADEWARVAAELGAGYVVLTAKHHDGFCLWPTETTNYSVASSPWRGGRGDLVGELERACRRYGLGFGIYLSPWDRNAPCYENPTEYDEFYLRQLRELCTNYGELTEIWFDGAGSAGRSYDWNRIGELIEQTQPQAMIFNMGPATIRWVGNEDGLASDPCTYVTDRTDLNNYDDDVVMLGEQAYIPPECDVSVRRGWFWHPDDEPKSLQHLLAIHDRSLGLGANLLLNIPPDRRGRIDSADLTRLREWRAALDARFGSPVQASIAPKHSDQIQAEPQRALHDDGNAHPYRWRAHLPQGTVCDHVELREDLRRGQAVLEHRVITSDGREIASGHTIGVRRIHRLAEPVAVDELLIEIIGDAYADQEPPTLSSVLVHDARCAPTPDLPDDYRAPTETPED